MALWNESYRKYNKCASWQHFSQFLKVRIVKTDGIVEMAGLAKHTSNDRGLRLTIHTPRSTISGCVGRDQEWQPDSHLLDLSTLIRQKPELPGIDVTPAAIAGDIE